MNFKTWPLATIFATFIGISLSTLAADKRALPEQMSFCGAQLTLGSGHSLHTIGEILVKIKIVLLVLSLFSSSVAVSSSPGPLQRTASYLICGVILGGGAAALLPESDTAVGGRDQQSALVQNISEGLGLDPKGRAVQAMVIYTGQPANDIEALANIVKAKSVKFANFSVGTFSYMAGKSAEYLVDFLHDPNAASKSE